MIHDLPFTDHVPTRPSWDCLQCDQPWPCASAKVQLVEEYLGIPTSLGLYLAMALHDAIDDAVDCTGIKVGELFDRFLGWDRRVTQQSPDRSPADDPPRPRRSAPS